MRIEFDGVMIIKSPIDAEKCRGAAEIVQERGLKIESHVNVGAHLEGVPGWADSSYALTRSRIFKLRDTLLQLVEGKRSEVRVHHTVISGGAKEIARFLREKALRIDPNQGNVPVYTSWIVGWHDGSRQYDANKLNELANHLEDEKGRI